MFKDKKILVIGGTGAIGDRLVNRLLREEPEVIRVFSRDEYKQYLLQNEINHYDNLSYLIGDIRDYQRLSSAMQDIDYVFHLAAMKHVPSCEYNPYEAVQTNVHGTYNVIQAAMAQGVEKVLFTSSDKAVSPTNTYGATKLTAERLISSTEYSKGEVKTIFASVRFGNVLGSRGSVVPLFQRQIHTQRKITVTDLNMTRFMMTLNQATELMMEALQKAEGGEVFVLKMPVILLKDLAEVVIDETCQKHQLNHEDIQIEEIGLRPGEKMYEELMTYDESTMAWELEEMYIIPGHQQSGLWNLGANRTDHGTYSSNRVTPISVEEVRQLLLSEQLID
ncbi:SDR family NAD(P)-dependent oxidoreductase [Alkalibacillus aidingensis]|uniref:SDR family NAD(P)-dependent oxidoreductase n=1 Tax=Alkalibacillus aidingensis TaxID=2747607 RepID=UPI001660A6B1|nr:SDR family NAD(P)-dependent oxidoreductase [Alkalibacillus aidingensis]